MPERLDVCEGADVVSSQETTIPSGLATGGRGVGPRSARRFHWLVLAVALVLLAQMAAAMCFSLSGESATFDEVGHLGGATGWYQYGNLNMDSDHPPLALMWAGLPVQLQGAKIPPNEPTTAIDETGFGRALLFTLNSDGRHLLWLARVQMVLLTLLFAAAAFGFARDLFGNLGGLVALGLASVCPNIIANGGLVDTDVAVSGWILITVWMTWRGWTRDSRWYFAAAVAMGFALTSKYTATFFVPPLCLVLFLAVWSQKDGSWKKKLGWCCAWIAAFMSIGLAIIWLVYLAIDPHLRWAHPPFSGSSSLLKTAALHLPVPMPYRQALAFLAQHKTPAFLFGDRYLGGRAYFYPALVAVKTPLASLVLWVAGLVVLLANRRRRKLAAFLLFPLLFFLSIAVAGHFNIGVRHILPLYFFMPVVAGAVVLVKRRWALAATVALIALAGVSTWSQYPSYLAYVNEAFGGPNNAYKLVSDSNLDWGQDLYHAESYLKEWFPHRQVALAYFGTVPVEPSVDFFSPSHAAWRRFGAATPHVIAISCSWEVYNPTLWHQVVRWAGPEPVAQVGHSILIFQRP